MITSITLKNFKSVYDLPVLPLAPLTVISGCNSAGKSAIIQSILLVAQTLISDDNSSPLVLNGQFMDFGSLSDVISDDASEQVLTIGARCSVKRRVLGQPFFVNEGPLDQPYVDHHVQELPEATYSFNFSIGLVPNETEPKLLSSSVCILSPELEETDLIAAECESQDQITTPKTFPYKRPPGEPYREQKVHKVTFGDEFDISDSNDGQFEQLVALAMMSNFLPDSFASQANMVEAEALDWIYDWRHSGPVISNGATRFAVDDPDVDAIITTHVRNAITQYLSKSVEKIRPARYREIYSKLVQNVAASDFSQESYDQLMDFMKSNGLLDVLLPVSSDEKPLRSNVTRKPSSLLNAVPASPTDRSDLEAGATDGLPERDGLVRFSVPTVERGITSLREFLTTGIQYLKPLRLEPRTTYSRSTKSEEQRPVEIVGSSFIPDRPNIGLFGEFAAEVLHERRGMEVKYLSPEALLGGRYDASEYVELVQAVLEWGTYIGVISDVSTAHLGPEGYDLEVGTNGVSYVRPLTHVGVGVSQVMPILIMGLVAEPGSTLMFEQPELHLHPRAQSKLADFFYALSKLGKQCIVETHSEMLINRLRYHIVAASDSETAQNEIAAYFAEIIDGRSSYTAIKFNAYGAIENWPKGFLDDGAELAATIIELATLKRKRGSRDERN
jgi:hypothetical protein